jgi:hypothetical protein
LRGQFAKHEHWFLAFSVQVFEQGQWLLIQIDTAFLVPINDVKSILPPICLNVVLPEGRWKHFVARVFQAYTERLEDLH